MGPKGVQWTTEVPLACFPRMRSPRAYTVGGGPTVRLITPKYCSSSVPIHAPRPAATFF